jgi:SNF2 family DNA or RNA helicase
LHAWHESFTDLKGLVLDESHYIKNATTRRAKAAIELSDRVDADGVVLCLSGTPVLNNASELIPQLRVIGRLKDFGGVREFRRRYGYVTNLTELNRKLRSSCYVRRRKAEVLTELPAKRWSEIYVEGDAEVMKEYREAEQNLIAYLANKAREYALEAGASDIEARNAAWEAQMRAKAAEHLVAVTNLKKIAARAKMKAAEEWIADFLETDKKLVAFGWHRSTVDMVAEKFARNVKVQGGMDDADRQASVDAFQTDETQKVISCSIKAAGVGLTLTAASDVLFLEQGWTPADMEQAADRCHRIGQTDSVTAWNLLCADTIDEYIAELIADKRALVDAATEGGDDQQQASVLGDLLVRLASRGMEG